MLGAAVLLATLLCWLHGAAATTSHGSVDHDLLEQILASSQE